MKRDLEIQIMDGRMKGQAFVTFPTILAAEEAVNQTNGYTLRGKPMVLSFSKTPKRPRIEEEEKDTLPDVPGPIDY